jgi:hypothetical protein
VQWVVLCLVAVFWLQSVEPVQLEQAGKNSSK